jgi:hypothetical protein
LRLRNADTTAGRARLVTRLFRYECRPRDTFAWNYDAFAKGKRRLWIETTSLTGNSLAGLRRKAALSPPAWTIRAKNDFIFCMHCHLADHFEPGPKHVRASWYSAGRVSCPIHRHWLWSARARFGCGRIDRSLREHEELPLSVWSEHFHAECTVLNRIWDSDPEVPLALRELESTIHAARRNVAPDEDEWGTLDAAEFLLVFRDVASWALTNFQPFPAPPAASTAIGQRSLAHLGSFQWGYRRHLPWDHRRGATQIHTVFDPSVRRGALWAAHTLMAVRHPRDPRDRRAHCLRERRRRLFRYENVESMAWLVACARHWPRAYVRDHWDRDDVTIDADYIAVEVARHVLGAEWLPEYVSRANQGGIERVLV